MSRKEVEDILQTEKLINEATKDLKKTISEQSKHIKVVPVIATVVEQQQPKKNNKDRHQILTEELPPLYPLTNETIAQNIKRKPYQKLTSFNEFVGLMNQISEKTQFNNCDPTTATTDE